METVTIDKLNIQSHQRYAEDQSLLDPTFLVSSKKVPVHSEVIVTNSAFVSQWGVLFGLNLCHVPWAQFCPPARFQKKAHQFFSYRIIPSLLFPTEDEDKEREENKQRFKEFLHKQDAKNPDRKILEELIDTLFHLDDLLGKILAKKLQYHKG